MKCVDLRVSYDQMKTSEWSQGEDPHWSGHSEALLKIIVVEAAVKYEDDTESNGD